jgi:hypothetical protein
MKQAMLRRHVSFCSAMTAVALVIASGCAHLNPSATIDRLPDGTLRVQCETRSLPECLVRAEEACGGARYKVLAAVDRHDYRGSPSTMSESESRSAEAVIRCGHRGRSLTSDEETKLPPLAGTCPPAPAAKPAEPAAVCVPGTTQECLGAGACRGAQSCLPDRSGFTPCDCGPAPTPAAPPHQG